MPRKISAKSKLKRKLNGKLPNKPKRGKPLEMRRSKSVGTLITETDIDLLSDDTQLDTNENRASSYPNSHLSSSKTAEFELKVSSTKKPKIDIIGDSWSDITELTPNQKNEHKIKVIKKLNQDIQQKPTRAIFYFKDPQRLHQYNRQLRALAMKHSNPEVSASILELLGTLLTVSDLSTHSVNEIIQYCSKAYPVTIVLKIAHRISALASYKEGVKAIIKLMKEMEEVFIFEEKHKYKVHQNAINGYVAKDEYEAKNEDIESIISCIQSYGFLLSELTLDKASGQDFLKLFIKAIKNSKHKRSKLQIAELILLLIDKNIISDEEITKISNFFEKQIPALKQKHNKTKDGRREWSDLCKTAKSKIPAQIESIKIQQTKYYFDTHTNLSKYNFVKSIIKYGFQIHCLRNPFIQRILYIAEIQPKYSQIDDDDDDDATPVNYTKKAKTVLQHNSNKKHRQKQRNKQRHAKRLNLYAM